MSRILKETHTSAQRLHDAGFLDATTMREFDALRLPPVPAYSPTDVKRIRATMHVSQAGHMDARDLIKTLQNALRGEDRPHQQTCGGPPIKAEAGER